MVPALRSRGEALRIGITGHTGFIGRHLAGSLAPLHEFAAFYGDVREEAAFADRARDDVLVHLAARANVRESVEDPHGVWSVNVDGTLRALDWARRRDVGRFVLVSSAHVYGVAKSSPIDETHPLDPVTPYGASKVAAEMATRAYHRSYGLDTVVLRLFNVYGPGQGKGYLIPDILAPLKAGREPTLRDPRPVRDFTYVSDVVDALLRAATRPGLGGRVLNIGSGKGYSVDDVAQLAVKAAGATSAPRYTTPGASGDLLELVVDNRAARAALAWTPVVDLPEGIQRTWLTMA